ncbi:MAG: YggS family pyridoxal phosphate-dependent enzyme [Spirochaetes bacterium]|nr:YggS family pyridoxal phosphate-dependent enzyme [Spirochaetota bacterium]
MVNLEPVMNRIQEAALRAGRRIEEIRVMGVTKSQPWEIVLEAYQSGIRVFGENRVQEAREKYKELLPGMELHLIGHLQSNKVKYIPSLFSWVDSIDRFSIAEELAKRWAKEPGVPSLQILLELNTSGERSKSGYPSYDVLLRDMERILSLPHVQVRGLMTVGPLTTDTKVIRTSFRMLNNSFQDLKRRYPEVNWDTLSMGMSGDFEIAIEEGSTLVRLGTILFGERRKE